MAADGHAPSAAGSKKHLEASTSRRSRAQSERPGVRPEPLRERSGSVREHLGSVKRSLLAMENWAHGKNHLTMPQKLLLCPSLRAKFCKKIISNKLGNAFRKKWRTAVPPRPDGARKAPPRCPGARPRAFREHLGSVREHPGSVRASLIGEENWARAKDVLCFLTLLAKLKKNWEMRGIGNGSRQKWRTAVPLWPDWAWRTPPGRLTERPGASRERPSGEKKILLAIEKWAHAKQDKNTTKNLTFPKNAKTKEP